ncbi:MAG: cysteine desulfurase family protein [Flammeovirgaceae bacterium]
MQTTKNVYLDNAATTPLDKEVISAMLPLMEQYFGNPSSTHAHGREVRAIIEQARKTVAELIHAKPAEIFFTSGGTESDNTFIRGVVETHGIQNIISSRLEHHAVSHTIEDLTRNGKIQAHWLKNDEKGVLDLNHLESLLQKHPKSLVSVMHGNNEIGNINPIEQIADLCAQYKAYFHSDTVQTMGHFELNVQKIKVHSVVGSAHKFHGPKGIGFLYMRKEARVQPFITGGAQEREMRGGTENVYGIVGLAKALELSLKGLEEHRKHILHLKALMIRLVKERFGDKIQFNGLSGDLDRSLYTVLNLSLPEHEANDMLLFKLDLSGVSASGGSACSSGAKTGSHVLQALNTDPKRGAVRFSFSKFNTEKEIRFAVDKLCEIYDLVSISQ